MIDKHAVVAAAEAREVNCAIVDGSSGLSVTRILNKNSSLSGQP
jgi:hypothetical protein